MEYKLGGILQDLSDLKAASRRHDVELNNLRQLVKMERNRWGSNGEVTEIKEQRESELVANDGDLSVPRDTAAQDAENIQHKVSHVQEEESKCHEQGTTGKTNQDILEADVRNTANKNGLDDSGIHSVHQAKAKDHLRVISGIPSEVFSVQDQINKTVLGDKSKSHTEEKISKDEHTEFLHTDKKGENDNVLGEEIPLPSASKEHEPSSDIQKVKESSALAKVDIANITFESIKDTVGHRTLPPQYTLSEEKDIDWVQNANEQALLSIIYKNKQYVETALKLTEDWNDEGTNVKPWEAVMMLVLLRSQMRYLIGQYGLTMLDERRHSFPRANEGFGLHKIEMVCRKSNVSLEFLVISPFCKVFAS